MELFDAHCLDWKDYLDNIQKINNKLLIKHLPACRCKPVPIDGSALTQKNVTATEFSDPRWGLTERATWNWLYIPI